MNWQEQVILLTGGTGSFGHEFVRAMLEKFHPKVVRIFSRDELKQYEMQKKFNHPSLRYLIGDVRDKERVHRAMEGVTLVVHAAALKHVPVCEYNPFEAVKTNIIGAQNIIEAAIEHDVPRTVALSTDKATNPTNLYGATKLCLERLFIAANSYAGLHKVRFSCVRYGNVVGSRGSVVPLWLGQAKSGSLAITDSRMTRFWITLDQGVKLVTDTAESMHGGEVFVPKIPSMKMTDLARVIGGPSCQLKEVGIRPGEKLHEALLTEDEARHTVELADKYVVEPEHHWWNFENWKGKRPADGFRYESHTNTEWLKDDELLKMVDAVARENNLPLPVRAG